VPPYRTQFVTITTGSNRTEKRFHLQANPSFPPLALFCASWTTELLIKDHAPVVGRVTLTTFFFRERESFVVIPLQPLEIFVSSHVTEQGGAARLSNTTGA
jgi:hypothetical protein